MMGTGSIAAIMTGTGRQSCCHHDGLIFGVRAGASNVGVAIVLFSSWFFFMCVYVPAWIFICSWSWLCSF